MATLYQLYRNVSWACSSPRLHSHYCLLYCIVINFNYTTYTFSNNLSFFSKNSCDSLLKVCNSIFPMYLHLLSWLLPLFDERIILINLQDSELFLLPKYDCISKHFLSQNSYIYIYGYLPFFLFLLVPSCIVLSHYKPLY